MANLTKISKSPTISLEEITKNAAFSYYFRLLELYDPKILRITEGGFKRLLEDSPQDIGIKILKNSGTLTKIPKS